jgi:phosphohistidine phosphatase
MVKDLWLVRHGEAVPESVDPSRPLSAEGIGSIKKAAQNIAAGISRLDLVAASGKLRARQTAEIIAAAAGYAADRIVETKVLSPGAAPGDFLSFLEEHEENESILCVGHLPSIAIFASVLLSSGGDVKLVFGPGTACRIRLSAIRPGSGELLLLS